MCYFLFRCVYLQPLLLEAVFPWQQQPTGRLVVVSRSLNLRLDLCGPSGPAAVYGCLSADTNVPHPNTPEQIKKKDINPSRRYVLIRRAVPRASEEAAKRKEGGRERERDTLAWIQDKWNCTDAESRLPGPANTPDPDLSSAAAAPSPTSLQ